MYYIHDKNHEPHQSWWPPITIPTSNNHTEHHHFDHHYDNYNIHTEKESKEDMNKIQGEETIVEGENNNLEMDKTQTQFWQVLQDVHTMKNTWSIAGTVPDAI